MKVLLIYPPVTLHTSDPTFPGAFPPLGLAYIASVLEQNGHTVRILDALGLGIERVERTEDQIRFGLSETAIVKYVREFWPDIVGISCHFTAYSRDSYRIARLVKGVKPSTVTVVGGAHASAVPEEALGERDVDIVVRGEGEMTMLEIVENSQKGGNIYNLNGTVVRKGNSAFYNESRPLIQDIDTLPMPSRHLLPMKVYFDWKRRLGVYDMRHPNTQVITSRGCPMACVFCSAHTVWGHTWRARSADNVLDEIEFLVHRYGVEEIQFVDDNISLDKKRMIRICKGIIERKIDIKWSTPNGIAIWTLDRNMIELMKKSGCYRLSFGIESGSLKTQKFIGKNLNLDLVRKIISIANQIGMWTIGFFIIGFPYESEESIVETIKFALSSDLDYATFYLPMPFPGTRLREIQMKEGFLNSLDIEQFALAFSGTGGCPTMHFSAQELQEFKNTAYSNFLSSRMRKFLNPIRMLRKVHSQEDLEYLLRIAKSGIKISLDRIKYSRKKGYRPVSMRVD